MMTCITFDTLYDTWRAGAVTSHMCSLTGAVPLLIFVFASDHCGIFEFFECGKCDEFVISGAAFPMRLCCILDIFIQNKLSVQAGIASILGSFAK